MKKIFLILMVLAAFVYGCQSSQSADGAAGLKSKGNAPEAGEGSPVESQPLSDFQIAACSAADEAGTCDTRLAELGIVLKEECCGALGKCC